MTLMSYDEAIKIVLDSVEKIGWERVTFTQALGRVLAKDVVSDVDLPMFDNSAMDGYAVRHEDLKAPETKLRVIGEISAGSSLDIKVEKGTAIRIFTGAPIPIGCDCVVPVEFTSFDGEYITVKGVFKEGANIRRKGEELRRGDVVLEGGTLIRGYEIGILAFLNKVVVDVYKKPVVGILATGDEIVDVGEPITRDSQIRTSNNYTLYGLACSLPVNVVNLGIAKDDPQQIKSSLSQIYDFDVFITTGGVSMGDRDYVQYLVKEIGIDVKFHKLRIKPAKPVLFGTYEGNKLFFGLPGNPVSCAIAFDILVKPAIKKMVGMKDYMPKPFKAILKKDFKRRDAERREFVRSYVEFADKVYCTYSEKLQSHMLSSYVGMNAYMIVYEGVTEIPAGTEVDVITM